MIDHLDHLVITTTDEAACIRFYVEVLGMRHERYDRGRQAFLFGNQKINVPRWGHEFEPKAHTPVPGGLDLCFIATIPLVQVIDRLNQHGVAIIVGPVLRDGAVSRIRSVYVRDPDLNLIEIAEPVAQDAT